MRIIEARVTPIAFRDPPLLNVSGVHEAFALRSIIEVQTDDGLVGLGESYGDLGTLKDLAAVAPLLVGMDPFDLAGLASVAHRVCDGTSDFAPQIASSGTRSASVAHGAFEVAFLDLQARSIDRPLCDLLGGRVRDRVPYSAYLFYKFGRHRDDGDMPDDAWGECLSHAQMVGQARQMIDRFGFGSIKLKAGVFEPDFEIDTLRALRAAFTDHPLRIDPNGGWSVATTRRLMPQLSGLLEYLEDPVNSLVEMGEVAAFATMPLATNMCTVEFGHIPETVRLDAVQVILSDHHYWGGLKATQHLAAIGRVFDIGISMHSNSHMGISLAAMTHVGATIPNLAYAADTHYPWQVDEVIAGGKLAIVGGCVAVPDGPGLGVTLDREALARLHRQYLSCGIRKRDDATEMRKYDPGFDARRPRF